MLLKYSILTVAYIGVIMKQHLLLLSNSLINL
jgi:hypothetical protein